jgi:hypothetical protein
VPELAATLICSDPRVDLVSFYGHLVIGFGLLAIVLGLALFPQLRRPRFRESGRHPLLGGVLALGILAVTVSVSIDDGRGIHRIERTGDALVLVYAILGEERLALSEIEGFRAISVSGGRTGRRGLALRLEDGTERRSSGGCHQHADALDALRREARARP